MEAKYFFPENSKLRNGTTYAGQLYMALILTPREEEEAKNRGIDPQKRIEESGTKRIRRAGRVGCCNRISWLFYGALPSLDNFRRYMEIELDKKCKVVNPVLPRFEQLMHLHSPMPDNKLVIFKDLAREPKYQDFGKLFVALRSPKNPEALQAFKEECTHWPEEAKDFWESSDGKTCFFRTYRHRIDRIREALSKKGFHFGFEVERLSTFEVMLNFYAVAWK